MGLAAGVKVWDPETGSLIHSADVARAGVLAMARSTNGDSFFHGGLDPTIYELKRCPSGGPANKVKREGEPTSLCTE